MESPRSVSPVRSGSADSSDAEPLTPTSKVKAMLASMEDSDDEDVPVHPVRSRISKSMMAKPSPDYHGSTQRTSTPTAEDNDEAHVALFCSPGPEPLTPNSKVKAILAEVESSEEDSASPVKPMRSRTAMAMRANHNSDQAPTPIDEAGDDDEDLPGNPANSRFLELVAKKRREREALEAEREKQRIQVQQSFNDEEDSGISAEEGDQTLTQSTRQPRRKAGKKAQEEMARETQRMARNMQLAHQARTKRKIGKDSLFAKFNYRPSTENAPQTPPTSSPILIAVSEVPETKETSRPSVTGKLSHIVRPVLDDSDSDLEILPDKKSTIFDFVSKHAAPPKKREMNNADLQVSLQQRARAQAKREREERLDMLRAKGVIVQTAEERQKEMAEVEDLISQARREGEDIMKREKEAAKKVAKENGEVDPLGDSSDEDWEEGGDEADDEEDDDGDESGIIEDEAIELSGSENEEDDAELGDEEDGEMVAVDDETATKVTPSDPNLEPQHPAPSRSELELAESDDDAQPINLARKRNMAVVISDDEDEEDTATPIKTPAVLRTFSPYNNKTDSPMAPSSVLRSAHKSFIPGLPITGPAGLGLTQIFAGTMDDSQSQNLDNSQTSERPDSQVLDPSFAHATTESQDLVPNSQPDEVSQGIQLDFSQSQIRGFDSMLLPLTQYSDSQFVVPTQDVGFQSHVELRGRYSSSPPATIDTEKFSATLEPVVDTAGSIALVEASPSPAKKMGRLQRGRVNRGPSPQTSAFAVLGKMPRLVIEDTFDKKNSEAKGMVHEQAEESEDEYAGLGGASDDESGGEEDAYVKEMIDDEAGKDVDEAQLAAFFANKERESDSKAVEKLFKDITTGNLRRKRGADYDLEDSDDDGEARRRMKQREFAKMRKALMADERVEKMAENPKSLAFLRSIEDRADEDEDMEMEMEWQKPTELKSIRLNLSQLVEEDSFVEVEDRTEMWERVEEVDEDDEEEEEHEQEQEAPLVLSRRTSKVIDRISLKRESSSALSSTTRLAFAAPSLTSSTSFKVPALLRRATTNSSLTTDPNSSLGVKEPSGNGAKKAGRNSGIHRQSSKAEWEKKKEESEKIRKDRKYKGAGDRRVKVGGLFNKGSFE